MTRPRLKPWLLAAAAVVGTAGTVGTAVATEAGAAELGEALSERWYYTEVVVFERPEVDEEADGEDLLHGNGRVFPIETRAFRPGPEGFAAGYRLAPRARLDLVFPYLDPDALEGEPDPRPAGDAPPPIAPELGPDPLLDYLAARAAFEERLRADAYRWLDEDTFTLDAEARRLERAGGYRILHHGRWLQPVPPRESPQPLLVQAGRRYGDAFALEGTVGVTRGRYLHFRADLVYREPLLGLDPIDRPLPPPGAPAPPPAPLRAVDLEGDADAYMQLGGSRRLRDGELHYLDHPKLGVLVRIEPVAVPERLSAARADLEESAE
ncbi:MAG: CsiV family protein [Pseudomonadota bacterium]